MESIKKPFFKRKGGIILIVILVLLITTVISVFAFWNQILRGLLGPTKYYLLKEEFVISDISDDDFGLQGELSLGDDYSSILAWTGADQTKIDMDIQWSNSQDKKKINLDFLGFLNLEVKSQGNLTSFCFNDGDVIVATTEEKKSSGNKTKKNTTTKADTEEMSGFSKLMWIYDVLDSPVVDEIDENCVETSYKEFNGIECKVDTFNINGSNFAQIFSDFANRLEGDEDTQYIYKKDIANILKKMGIVSSNDVSEIVKLLRELAQEYVNDKDGFQYSVYYDGGDIVNREYKSNDNTLSIGYFKKGNDDYISFNYNSIEGEFKILEEPDVSDVNIDGTNAKSYQDIIGDIGGMLGDLIFNSND